MNGRIENKNLISNININCLIFGTIFSFPLLICITLNFFLIFKYQYKDGYIKDLLHNWEEKPIISIDIENIGENGLKRSRKSSENYKWKGNEIKIQRLESNYYESLKENNNLKLCGTDSNGNKLYFEECPINYIEITKNEDSYISKFNDYKIEKINLGGINLFYSNTFINGKILVDFQIGDFLGPCNDESKNNLFPFYSNYKVCKDNIIDNSYINLDDFSFSSFENENKLNGNKRNFENNDYIYLYGRSYIAFNNIDNLYQVKDIKKYINKNKILRIFVLVLLCVYLVLELIICYYNTDYNDFCNTLPVLIKYVFICLIMILICLTIIIEFLIRKNDKKIQILLKFIYHQVSEKYSKNQPFMKITFSLLFFYFLNFILFIYLLLIYENRKEEIVEHNSTTILDFLLECKKIKKYKKDWEKEKCEINEFILKKKIDLRPEKRKLTEAITKYIEKLNRMEDLRNETQKMKLKNLSNEILEEIENMEKKNQKDKNERVKKLCEQVKKLKDDSVYDLYNLVKESKDTLFRISFPN